MTDTISINYPELNKDLQKIKKQLLFKKDIGLLGAILCATELLFSFDTSTGCTNGKWVKLNPNYWISLTDNYKLFLLAHELLHIVLMHPFRFKEGMNQDRYGTAADIVVNNLLVESGFELIPGGIFEPWYTKMTTEQVYDSLDPIDYKDPPDDIVFNDDKNDFDDTLSNIKVMSQGNESIDEIHNFINNVIKPKLDWKDLLKNYLTALSNKTKYSYKRVKKINGFSLPKLVKTNKLTKLNFYIDVSGSISEHEIKLFFSELNSIKNNLNPSEMNIIQFDCYIQSELLIRETDSIIDFEIIGRGGTDLEPVVQHINDNTPSCAIIMTDLGVDSIPDKPRKTDVIWINTCESSTLPTYGHIITINPEEYNDR